MTSISDIDDVVLGPQISYNPNTTITTMITTTKTAAALIAAGAMSLLGAVTPAAFAQDGSLVSFNQNILNPQHPNLSFSLHNGRESC
jgi:hypothetical protein